MPHSRAGLAHPAHNITPQGRLALEDFKAVLESCKRTSVIHVPPRDFILVDGLLEWYRSEPEHEPGTTNAGRLLRAVLVHGSRDPIPPKLIQDLLQAMTPGEDCWLMVFTILLQLRKGKYIGRFCDSRIRDHRLPLSLGDLCTYIWEIPGFLSHEERQEPEQFARQFAELQHQLCTQNSLDSENGRIDPMGILPICTMDPIKPGSRVYQIEIPHECVPNKIVKRIKPKPHEKEDKNGELYDELALKVLHDRQDYEQESWAYGALKGREGIVQCLGFWELQKPFSEPEYHLLLEYGSCDLDDYFETYPPPSLPQYITEFWKELKNVAVALDEIHNIKYEVEGATDIYYGWHGDIKPENILACGNLWKITDPGFAMLKHHTEVKRDENGLPVVELRGGTETYGPPEQAINPRQPVTQLFDIWSLGCVFSEAATYLLLGYRGVEQFRRVRKVLRSRSSGSKSSQEARGDDCFYYEGELSRSVLDWHNFLRGSMRAGDHITRAILDLVEEGMLVRSVTQRLASNELVRRLDLIIQKAEEEDALSTYQLPPYFGMAFNAEQEEFSDEQEKSFKGSSDHSQQSTSRKSNRYKSRRFQIPPGSLPVGPPSQSRYPQFPEAPSRSTTQYSLQDTIRASRTFDLSRSQSPPEVETNFEDTNRFNYWDARELLESEGWVHTGALEFVSRSRELPSPPVSNPSLSPAQGERSKRDSLPPLSRPATRYSFRESTALKGMFNKFKRNSRSSTDFANLRNQSMTPPATGRLRTDTGALIGGVVNTSHRHNEFDQFFKKRDIIFLIDNGATMARHWPMLRDLVAVLVALLRNQDDNGMDFYFTSSKIKYGPFKEPKDFLDTINQMKPKRTVLRNIIAESESKERADDIREALSQVLNLIGDSGYDRKLTLIILTDGIWRGVSQKRTVANLIVSCIERWGDRDPNLLENRGLSLQFVQFGDDKDATDEFKYMDDEIATWDGAKLPDIIDVEPATGNVKKMILGSLSEEWDGGAPATTVTSDDSQSKAGERDLAHSGSPPGLFSSPIQTHLPHALGLVEEPYEDMTLSRNPIDYNTERDTERSGSQFKETSPSTTRPSTGRPLRQMSGQEVPLRQRKRTDDSFSSPYHGGRSPG